MLAVQRQPRNMFQTSPVHDSGTPRRHYEQSRRTSSTGGPLPSFHAPSRSVLDLPRPSESRPPSHHPQHHHAETEQPMLYKAPEAYRRLATSPSSQPLPEGRAIGPSLPGLRDILTPAGNSADSYPSWNSARASATSHFQQSHQQPPVPLQAQSTQQQQQQQQQQRPTVPPPAPPSGAPLSRNISGNDAYHSYPTWHPPMALHPPPEAALHYQTQAERRMDIGIVENHPSGRHPPQTLPLSPYSAYQEGREYNEARTERSAPSAANPYHANGVSSPYSVSGGHDESHYGSSGPMYDRIQPHPDGANGPETQRKYVGIKDIPGEGSFHIYEGGYRIPTHVDGEQVNPAWGLTKANKPRKRLALACLDCREKKIKCEPGALSCLQCEKAKRPCRRAPPQLTASEIGGPLQQQQQQQQWTTSATSPPHRYMAESSPIPLQRETDYELSHKRRAGDPLSPQAASSKKQRSTSPGLTPATGPSTAAEHLSNPFDRTLSPQGRLAGRESGYMGDPFAANQGACVHLVEQFFLHANSAVAELFPRASFIHWLTTCADKTQDEQMVLHALLAVGSMFGDGNFSDLGKTCADIAAQAITARVGQISTCNVQARILLGLYNAGKGRDGAAWDYSGSAIRAATSNRLKLNLEDGCMAGAERPAFLLGREQTVECRRRTFWACFLMDRFAGGTHCAISLQDVFVRLPCANDLYERNQPTDAPLFEMANLTTTCDVASSRRLSPIAWLILFASVWGDVLDFLHRAPHRSQSTYRDAYETFHARVHQDLQHLMGHLPEYLKHSPMNLERSMHDGFASTLITMHALYHFTLMKLNRCIRHKLMLDTVSRNISAAHAHAHALLANMVMLRNACRDATFQSQGTNYTVSTPFPGAMIMAAIDIVGAGGLESSLGTTMDAIRGGVDILRELSTFWSRADAQARDCQKRYYQIQNILSHPFKAKSGCWLGREWGMMERLENDFDLEDDCIYGITEKEGKPNAIYFDALKDTHHDPAYLRSGGRIA